MPSERVADEHHRRGRSWDQRIWFGSLGPPVRRAAADATREVAPVDDVDGDRLTERPDRFSEVSTSVNSPDATTAPSDSSRQWLKPCGISST